MTARRIVIAASAVVAGVLAIGLGTTLLPVSGMTSGYDTIIPGPSSPSTSEPSTPAPTPTPTAEPLTFAVVGDSISARAGRTGIDQSAGSWTSYAGAADLEYVDNGWAQNGATLFEMEANLSAVGADALVILAGTNDLTGGVPVADRLAIVGQLADQSGASRIVISAVPPFDGAPAASTEWNAALAEYASARGWQFVDPWSTLRTPAGSYIARFTLDGVHPTVAAAQIVGTVIHAALVESTGVEA